MLSFSRFAITARLLSFCSELRARKKAEVLNAGNLFIPTTYINRLRYMKTVKTDVSFLSTFLSKPTFLFLELVEYPLHG